MTLDFSCDPGYYPFADLDEDEDYIDPMFLECKCDWPYLNEIVSYPKSNIYE